MKRRWQRVKTGNIANFEKRCYSKIKVFQHKKKTHDKKNFGIEIVNSICLWESIITLYTPTTGKLIEQTV